jgi:hypothetical protein
MKEFRILKAVALGLVCLGILVPQTELWAAGLKTKVKSSRKAQTPQIFDVALTAGGTLTGKVLDVQGIAVEGAVVSIRRGRGEVARTVTNKNGTFVVQNLRGGLYQVVAGRSQGLFRFWAPNTAPPSARSQALIVATSQVLRGQAGMVGPDLADATAIILGATGAVLGAVALEKANSNAGGDTIIQQVVSGP